MNFYTVLTEGRQKTIIKAGLVFKHKPEGYFLRDENLDVFLTPHLVPDNKNGDPFITILQGFIHIDSIRNRSTVCGDRNRNRPQKPIVILFQFINSKDELYIHTEHKGHRPLLEHIVTDRQKTLCFTVDRGNTLVLEDQDHAERFRFCNVDGFLKVFTPEGKKYFPRPLKKRGCMNLLCTFLKLVGLRKERKPKKRRRNIESV